MSIYTIFELENSDIRKDMAANRMPGSGMILLLIDKNGKPDWKFIEGRLHKIIAMFKFNL